MHCRPASKASGLLAALKYGLPTNKGSGPLVTVLIVHLLHDRLHKLSSVGGFCKRKRRIRYFGIAFSLDIKRIRSFLEFATSHIEVAEEAHRGADDLLCRFNLFASLIVGRHASRVC